MVALERLVSIPSSATTQGIYRATALRVFRELRGEDRARNRGTWLIKLAILQREPPPELFAVKVKTADEIECLAEAVGELGKQLDEVYEARAFEKKRLRAVVARVRAVTRSGSV